MQLCTRALAAPGSPTAVASQRHGSFAEQNFNVGTFGPTDCDRSTLSSKRRCFRLSFPQEEFRWWNNTALYVAVYDSVDAAKADLDAVEQLHQDDLVGKFDAAVVDNENGTPHIVKRLDRPRIRVIPEELGLGPLSRKELKEAAAELSGNQAALIMVGEPTLDKAFDKAVTRAAKTVKQTVDTTTDELARELKGAVAS